jgi:hypothetical protein
MNDVDWPGLRAAAVAIGIRTAARQAARDLSLDEQERFVQRAMKRCSREKWLVKSEQVKADAVAMSPTALSAKVAMCLVRYSRKIAAKRALVFLAQHATQRRRLQRCPVRK